MLNQNEITIIVKKACSIMLGGHVPASCMNDTFIIDDEFSLSKFDFGLMRELIHDKTNLNVPYKIFENSSIKDIVEYITKRI